MKRSLKPECLLSLIPWFHAYGFLSHLIILNMNVRCVYMARFEEDAFLSAIQNYKVEKIYYMESVCVWCLYVFLFRFQVDMTSLVPPLLVFLAKHPLVDKYDLSSLKEIWCGAAPLSKEVQIAVTERLGIKTIRQGYGMTETSLAVLTNDSEEKVVYGSCGTVVPGTMAKVIQIFII